MGGIEFLSALVSFIIVWFLSTIQISNIYNEDLPWVSWYRLIWITFAFDVTRVSFLYLRPYIVSSLFAITYPWKTSKSEDVKIFFYSTCHLLFLCLKQRTEVHSWDKLTSVWSIKYNHFCSIIFDPYSYNLAKSLSIGFVWLMSIAHCHGSIRSSLFVLSVEFSVRLTQLFCQYFDIPVSLGMRFFIVSKVLFLVFIVWWRADKFNACETKSL